MLAITYFFYRWRRSIVILLLPLLLATDYAFALASLEPFGVTELNSNTAFLGSIIVGNGINFGIILLARFVEERRRGESTRDALVIAVHSARIGTFSAALGAAVAYGSLAVTEFRGFRQFGFIGGLGMLVSWLVTFVCMPPLIAALDDNAFLRTTRGETGRIMTALSRFTPRLAIPLVAIAVVMTTASVAIVSTFDESRIESDFSKLRRRDTWTSGEGYWGRRMDQLLGRYLTPTVVLLVAENRALFLFGVLAVLGELACLLCALVVLPAVLVTIGRLRSTTRGMTASAEE